MAQIYDPASPTDDNDYSVINESVSSQDSNAKESCIGKISEKNLGPAATFAVVNVNNAQVSSLECIPLPDELPVGVPVLNENLKSKSLRKTADSKVDNLLVESSKEIVEPAATTALDAATVLDVNTSVDTAVTSAACTASFPLQSMSKIQQLIQEKAAKLNTVNSVHHSANAMQTPIFSFGQTKQRKDKVKFSVAKVEKKSKIFDSDSDEEKNNQRVLVSHAKGLPPSSCIKPAELPADVIDKVSAVAKRIESRRVKEPAKLASPSSTTSKISSHFKSSSLDVPITYPIMKRASNEGKIAIEADSTVTEEGIFNKTDRCSDIEIELSPRSSGNAAMSSAAVTTSTATIKTSSSLMRTGVRHSLSDSQSKRKGRLSSESQVSDRDSAKEDNRNVRNLSKDRERQRSSSREQRHSINKEKRLSSSQDRRRDRSRGRRRSRSRSYDRSQRDYCSQRDHRRKTNSRSTERHSHSYSHDRKHQRSRSRQKSNNRDCRSRSQDIDCSKISENRVNSPNKSIAIGYENHKDDSENSKNSERTLNPLEKPTETTAPPLPAAALLPPEPIFQRTLEERISALENSSASPDDEGTPPPPPAPDGIVQPSISNVTFQLSNPYSTDVTQQDLYQQSLQQPLNYLLYNSTSNQQHHPTTYTPPHQSYSYYCSPSVSDTIRYPASQSTQLSSFMAPIRPVVPSLQTTIPSVMESGLFTSFGLKEKSVTSKEPNQYKVFVSTSAKAEEDFSMDISPGNSPLRTADNGMKPVTSAQSVATMHLPEEQGLFSFSSQLNDVTHTADAGQSLSACSPKLTNQLGESRNQLDEGSFVLGTRSLDSDMSTDRKESKESHDAQIEKRRSNRIKSKDERMNAEKRIQAHRANAAAEAVKFKPASSTHEEIVDFVIDSNTPARLPSRTDIQSSPLSHKASITSPMSSPAPGKLKMRWLKASEHDINEDAISSSDTEGVSSSTKDKLPVNKRTARALNTSESLESVVTDAQISSDFSLQTARKDLITSPPRTSKDPAPFDRVTDNIYLSSSKRVTKKQKEAKRMVCDCSTSAEDREMQMEACGEDCLNRMLMIECGSRCPCGNFCTNKRFQRHDNAKAETFLTEKKGHGLKALEPIIKGQFIREYVGEVLGYKEFKHRTKQYAKDNHKHYYFMALNTDEIIDATQKGNISRFINHSCDPNCETQKWTVNGILRIGFFAKRDIEEGEEITFDYQFERYGKEAQECYCGSANCRGTLGGARTQPLKPTDKAVVTKKKKEEKQKFNINEFDDDTLSEEISKLLACGGLGQSAQVIQVCRLMVRAENVEHRKDIISVLLNTHSENCLRLFLSYHGLSLLWSWMVDVGSGCNDLKLMIVKLLRRLPVTNRNAINDTKILSVVQRWAKEMKEKPFKNPTSEITEIVSLQESSPGLSCVPNPTGNAVAASCDNLETPIVKCVREVLDTTDDAAGEKSLSVLDSGCPVDHVNKPTEILHAKVIPGDEGTTEKSGVQLQEDDSNRQISDDSSKKIFLQKVWHESDHQGDDESMIERSKVDLPMPASVSCDTANADVQETCLKQTEKFNTQPDPSIQAEHRERTSQAEEQSHSSHEATADSEVETILATTCQGSVPEILLDESSQDSSSLQPNPKDDSQEKLQSVSMHDAEVREEMAECLDELLEDWSKLKESFKIPKKQEERKRTMIEIDARDSNTSNADRRDRRESRFDRRSDGRFDSRESRWDNDRYRPSIKDYRKRKRDDSPEYRRSRREDREDELKPMLTKQQRRERFEARVKAEEESQLQYEQYKSQQQQLTQTLPEPIQLQQFLDPLTGRSFVEPVYPTKPEPFYPVLPEPAPIVQQPTPTIDYHHGQVLVPQTVQYLDPQAQQIYAHTPSAVQPTVSAPVASAISASSVQPTQSVSYYTTPQGVLVQQIVQSAPQPQQIVYMVPEDEPPPPPAAPLQSQTPQLPTNWKAAKDAEGRTYFYHRQTRQTQWEMPTGGEEIGAAMELGTPPPDNKPATASTANDRKHPVKKSKKKTTTAPADTSSKDSAKKVKENFKASISVHVRTILNSYMKPDCKVGHITNKDDYKFLAKKLTHAVLDKELKHCRHPEDLEVNENVKFKAKEFVKKYMSRFGAHYKQEKEDSSKN